MFYSMLCLCVCVCLNLSLASSTLSLDDDPGNLGNLYSTLKYVDDSSSDHGNSDHDNRKSDDEDVVAREKAHAQREVSQSKV